MPSPSLAFTEYAPLTPSANDTFTFIPASMPGTSTVAKGVRGLMLSAGLMWPPLSSAAPPSTPALEPTNQSSKREAVTWDTGFVPAKMIGLWKLVASPAKSDVSLAGGTAAPEEYVADEEFRVSCRKAVAVARQLAAGQTEPASAEMLELARRAIQRQQQLREEDIEALAEKLARAVSGAVD